MKHLHLLVFLWGALSMACAVASLFFLRFYRDSSDRLFATFAAAFGFLALHWTLLALLPLENEHRPLAYLLRLLAFGTILAGIVDKNRRHD